MHIDGADLDAAFDPTSTEHAATAGTDTDQITIDPAADPNACAVDIVPADADPNTPGHQINLGPAGAVAVITVTAADNTTTATHTLTIGRGDTQPAAAADVGLDGVEVDFDPNQQRYEADIPPGTTQTTLDITPAGDSEVDGYVFNPGNSGLDPIADGGTVPLSSTRDTLVAVKVSAPDNSQQDYYTIVLQPPDNNNGTPPATPQPQNNLRNTLRPAAVQNSLRDIPRLVPAQNTPRNGGNSAEPQLSALSISPGTLAPAFAAGTHRYTATVDHDIDEITVAATAVSGASAHIAAPDADPDTAGHQIALNAGPAAQTAVLVVVTAGTKIDSYTLVVTRAAPPPAKARNTPGNVRDDPLDDDSSLSAFALDSGAIALSPVFASSTTAYTATVAASTGWVTVTATANSSDASVAITPADANPIAPGHQVDLAAAQTAAGTGQTTITATVTAEDATTTAYAVVVSRPAAVGFGRLAGADVDLGVLGVHWPMGLWSDGLTMWVADSVVDLATAPPRAVGVDLASGGLVSGREVELADLANDGNRFATDVWSDGETLWVLDRWRSPAVSAYDYATLARKGAADIDEVTFEGAMGMWSDGDTLWVVDGFCCVRRRLQDGSIGPISNPGVRVFDLATGERLSDREFGISNTDHSLYGPTDMWSDGETLWIMHADDRVARAYGLQSGDREPLMDIDFAGRDDVSLSVVRGMWSDGGTLWLSEAGSADRLVAFYWPTVAALDSLSVDGDAVAGFSPWDTDYTVEVAHDAQTATIEASAHHRDAAITYPADDADPNTPGHQITLSANTTTTTIHTGTTNHTITYTITITKLPD